MNLIMHTRPDGTPVDTAALLAGLKSHDGSIRWRACQQLVDMGHVAVPVLVSGLQAPDDHARWEAAKALCEIHAPEAAPDLVQRLDDDNFSVRWLAAEALAGLGDAAIGPLLQALIRRPDAVWLRQGAHHILRALASGRNEEALRPVIKALEAVEPILETPFAAEHALKELARAR